ncbi:hypothetical protein GCM10010399_92630 [Dactylosporangium fulvum]|uniref:Alpha/beta hydrolase-fold protein n=1 Tax=Dactylosporangium fulvum TaxID=53359 RepID=A0ABY5WBI8_9ACTN|nr:alpha/beta hydrolase-fold protein [Dactylosporangium fulvum]UWP86476.1 alpha/beta hydrolase-fold protein [Dactylosporangium fulvum]
MLALRELFFDSGFLDTVCEEIVPWAATALGITVRPEQTTVSGVGAGAGMALYAALTRPDVFTSVITQAAPCGTAVGGDRPGWLIDALATTARVPEAGDLETDAIVDPGQRRDQGRHDDGRPQIWSVRAQKGPKPGRRRPINATPNWS